MKTVTVRDLRNRYLELLRWLEAGEEIVIKRRGHVVAHLVPPAVSLSAKVDWTKSAAVRRDRRGDRVLSAKESAVLLRESQG
jgi:antitoxin (DNA-binding transcriptional repressor) of toxin-antitoxin stability system